VSAAVTADTFLSHGVECRATLYKPLRTAKLPCVVLAHGFDGVQDQLVNYAERFARGGLAAFVFDYRGFGLSDGSPRQNVSHRAQLEDWRAAINHAFDLACVDRRRVALWGTSTSGGHVVKLAADDPRIAAVVAQMPFTSGLAQFRSLPLTHSLRLVRAGLRDQVGAWLGGPGVRVAAGGQPRTLSVTTTRDALSGLENSTPPDSTWVNEVLARFALTTTFYRPGAAAKRLNRPLLVCIADGDRVIPIKPALELAAYGELRRYRYGHFGMYFGDGFEEVVIDQVAFLKKHLLKGRLES
jgi:alpha-beta hydrolase superfamily lysophospholipase